MKPDEFWELTPRELNEMNEGYNMEVEQQMERLAIHASWIINYQRTKKQKPVTPKRLLGKEKGPMSHEDKQAEFAKLMDLLKKRGGQ